MRRIAVLLPVVFAILVGAAPASAWTWPVEGPVMQPFNLKSDPYVGGQHRGIDIGAPGGSKVLAPTSGVISFAGSVPRGGLTVTILTEDGYAVTLVHLGEVSVTEGVGIEEGAVVGAVGPSGEPEHASPYVHLGTRVAAEEHGYVDPLSLLPPPEGGRGEPDGSGAPEQPTSSDEVGATAPTPEQASAPEVEPPALQAGTEEQAASAAQAAEQLPVPNDSEGQASAQPQAGPIPSTEVVTPGQAVPEAVAEPPPAWGVTTTAEPVGDAASSALETHPGAAAPVVADGAGEQWQEPTQAVVPANEPDVPPRASDTSERPAGMPVRQPLPNRRPLDEHATFAPDRSGTTARTTVPRGEAMDPAGSASRLPAEPVGSVRGSGYGLWVLVSAVLAGLLLLLWRAAGGRRPTASSHPVPGRPRGDVTPSDGESCAGDRLGPATAAPCYAPAPGAAPAECVVTRSVYLRSVERLADAA